VDRVADARPWPYGEVRSSVAVMRYPMPGVFWMICGSPSLRRSRPIVTRTVGDHAAQRVTVQAGEVAVEHDDVVGVEAEAGGAGEPVVGDVDGHALIAQAFGDQIRELRLVLDDQDPHARTAITGAGVVDGRVISTRRPP
jgi:hypothetical protein